jgi:hypothetical protein
VKKEFLIKSLNLNDGDAITLEKAEDRVEFEALISFNIALSDCTVVCGAFGDGPSCNPMPTPEPPPVPDPTPVPCPELK